MDERTRQIARRLMAFIVEELLDEGMYTGGDPLASDAVDSLDLEQVASFIEEEFGVVFDDDDMVEENFESVPALAALVAARQRGVAT